MKDYYMILGVKPDADADAIQKAFRHLAKRCHPDCGDENDASRFREITEAYESLSDPDKRKIYNRDRAALHSKPPRPGTPPRPKSPRYRDRPRRRMDNPTSFFHGHADALRDAEFSDTDRGREYAGTRPSSEYLDFEVMLSPAEARFGRPATFPVPFQTPCIPCSGTGMEDGWTCSECGGAGSRTLQAQITVRIPPGVQAGEVRLFPVNHPLTPFRAVRLFFR